MSTTGKRYDEDFKRTLVELYHNGKTQSTLIKAIIQKHYLWLCHFHNHIEHNSIYPQMHQIQAGH